MRRILRGAGLAPDLPAWLVADDRPDDSPVLDAQPDAAELLGAEATPATS